MSNIHVFKSDLTPSDVLKHLSDMKKVYDHVSTLNGAAELHQYFLGLEDDYIKKRDNNFCHDVHMLHPVTYEGDKK